MKILVSGSLRDMPEETSQKVNIAAAELGKAIAEAGYHLIVGSDDPRDIDPAVVKGFVGANANGQVEVHLQRDAAPCYPQQANVENVWHRYDDWDITVLEVVRKNADAVVVMGGRQGVVQAGIAGWMLGKPTIPFAGFKGGAQTVWEYGSSDRQGFYFGGLDDAAIDRLASPWEPTTARRIVEHIDTCARSARQGRISSKLRLGVAGGVLIALALWVVFLALPLLGVPAGVPPAPAAAENAAKAGELVAAPFNRENGFRFLLMLAAVCSAGVFGALVQSMRGIRDGAVVTGHKVLNDAILGIAAGFLTAALYLLAQIAITGKLLLPAANDEYARAAVIVSMAAVFASLYLDAAFARFDEFKDSVMAGSYGKKDDS